MQFIYFNGSQCSLKLFRHSETKQKFTKVESHEKSRKILVSYLFTSVVADRACFRKTSEMAGVKSWVSRRNFEMETISRFYAVLSLSLCMLSILYFVSRPFVIPKFKKEVKLFLQCHFLVIYFSQRKP